MRKITLLLVVTLVYECHGGLIKDILSKHHLSLGGAFGGHSNKRQSVNEGDPGTVILVVKEGELGYGKPGYGGHGGPGHQHHGHGYHNQHQYDHGQGERPGNLGPNHKPGYGGHEQYPHNKPGYGGQDQYPQNKPGYGGNQYNPEVPPYYGNDRPNYNGGHRPGYGGNRPGYGGQRPGHGHHSLESNSASSEESSEEQFGTGFRPPYPQNGGAFNQNQNGNFRPGFNNPNGPFQPGSGQYGNNNGNNNRPLLNQVKPVYETPNGQPSIEGPPVQQPNINQQPGNGQFQQNQGSSRPNPAFNTIPGKPQDPEGDPLLVPLDPTAEFNQHGGSNNEPKRETNEKPKPAAEDDEEYGIDIRYGDQ